MKLFKIVLCAAILLSLAVPVLAVEQLTENKYVIVNNSANKIATTIPASVLPAGSRITNWEVSPRLAPGATTGELVASVYDSANLWGTSAGWMEGEIESTVMATLRKEYIHPLRIINGFTVVQGAYTIFTVEWEDSL